jgi:hypothetical protein
LALEGACIVCGTLLTVKNPVGRNEECPKCGAEVRSCRQCASYDTSRGNDCREPQIEPVRNKEKANFCELYRFKTDGPSSTKTRDELRAAAEALFKKKP